jgi:bacterial leucyl aminopeptidase
MRVLLTDSKIAGGEAEHTIEFHWYAGEEAGLLGSADIFDEYAADGAEVVAMLQQDMTGFVSGDGAMGVITDFVDSSLTSFVKKVIDAYTEVGSVDSECGYGCSDHASATQAGFPSAFVIEAPFEETNQQIHTAQDTLDKVSIEHMAEHAKMVVGFVYELAFAAGL